MLLPWPTILCCILVPALMSTPLALFIYYKMRYPGRQLAGGFAAGFHVDVALLFLVFAFVFVFMPLRSSPSDSVDREALTALSIAGFGLLIPLMAAYFMAARGYELNKKLALTGLGAAVSAADLALFAYWLFPVVGGGPHMIAWSTNVARIFVALAFLCLVLSEICYFKLPRAETATTPTTRIRPRRSRGK